MRFYPRIVTSVAAIALTCFVSAAAYYYKSRKTEINDVMIFCKLQFNVFSYFDKLLSFIESAEKSINVCMPSIHNPAIQGRLVEIIKRKNIRTRLLIDENGYNESTAMFLEELLDVGAEIKFKVNCNPEAMHHKFCLIDDSTLMTGTLDWGNDLSCNNWNYVYITNKDDLVQPVLKGFYEMWYHEQNTLLVISDSDDERAGDDNAPAQPPKETANDTKTDVKFQAKEKSEVDLHAVPDVGHIDQFGNFTKNNQTTGMQNSVETDYPNANYNYQKTLEFMPNDMVNCESQSLQRNNYSIDQNFGEMDYYNDHILMNKYSYYNLPSNLQEDFISNQKSTAF